MAKSLRKEESYSFPRGPMTLGNAAKEAELALLADYMADVNGVVLDIKDQVDKGTLNPIDIGKVLDKVVEKHPRTTYEHKAMMGVVVSKNSTAAFDDGLELDGDDEVPWKDLAFSAMRRDVIDGLDAAGVEVGDIDQPTGADDDDDSDDESEDDDE